jgi:membrane-bound inhibitor of C-type lysozyme
VLGRSGVGAELQNCVGEVWFRGGTAKLCWGGLVKGRNCKTVLGRSGLGAELQNCVREVWFRGGTAKLCWEVWCSGGTSKLCWGGLV